MSFCHSFCLIHFNFPFWKSDIFCGACFIEIRQQWLSLQQHIKILHNRIDNLQYSRLMYFVLNSSNKGWKLIWNHSANLIVTQFLYSFPTVLKIYVSIKITQFLEEFLQIFQKTCFTKTATSWRRIPI